MIDKGATSPATKAARLKQVLMSALYFLLAPLIWFLFPAKTNSLYLIEGFIFGFAFFILVLAVLSPLLQRMLANRQTNRWVYEVHRIFEFDNSTIQYSYENGLFAKMPWEMVQKVMVDKHTIFVFTYFIPFHIPRSAIPNPGDEHRLLTFCQSRNLLTGKVPARA